jgi:hypothetical protein
MDGGGGRAGGLDGLVGWTVVAVGLGAAMAGTARCARVSGRRHATLCGGWPAGTPLGRRSGLRAATTIALACRHATRARKWLAGTPLWRGPVAGSALHGDWWPPARHYVRWVACRHATRRRSGLRARHSGEEVACGRPLRSLWCAGTPLGRGSGLRARHFGAARWRGQRSTRISGRRHATMCGGWLAGTPLAAEVACGHATRAKKWLAGGHCDRSGVPARHSGEEVACGHATLAQPGGGISAPRGWWPPARHYVRWVACRHATRRRSGLRARHSPAEVACGRPLRSLWRAGTPLAAEVACGHATRPRKWLAGGHYDPPWPPARHPPAEVACPRPPHPTVPPAVQIYPSSTLVTQPGAAS